MHGIYIRVSTFGQNTAGQKREIQNWLNGNGGSDVKVRWYIDKASGNDLNRPEFERLQKDIFDGKVNTVVVWKLDRLSRNPANRHTFSPPFTLETTDAKTLKN